MKKEDFEFCEFIDKNLYYFTYHDFIAKRIILKKIFKTLSDLEARFYKWYVYANINMNETYKNAIWEYLNFDDFEYEEQLMHLQTLLKR